MSSGRLGGRGADELRHLDIIASVAPHAEGSASSRWAIPMYFAPRPLRRRSRLDEGQGQRMGNRRIFHAARAPPSNALSAKPCRAKQGGRTVEIQRLIGRSLRSVINLKALGERQIIVDCDVILADGGTRCASITGGYVALAQAIGKLREQERISRDPLEAAVAAVSVGVVKGHRCSISTIRRTRLPMSISMSS